MTTQGFDRFRANGLGLRVNVTTSSQNLTLPFGNDSTFPRFCRFMVEPQSTGNGSFCYINLGDQNTTCQAGNVLVTSNEQVIMQTRGMTHVAAFHPLSTCFLNVLPLEDA